MRQVHGLIARDSELAELLSAVDAAIDAHGRVLVLLGEAGIGKSALAESVLRTARRRGVPTAIGRASSDRDAPPWWPWRTVLGQLGQRAGLPSLAGPREDQRSAPDVFAVIERVAGTIVAAAEPDGLLIVLEDMHWSDGASLRLLQHLSMNVTAARLLIVTTAREDFTGPTGEELASLCADPRVHIIRPAPLPVRAIEAWISDVTPGSVDPAWGARIRALSGGNPLYVGELARSLAADGRLSGPPGEIEVSGQLRGLIRTRTARLSEAGRNLLSAAAVAGEWVDLRLLAAVGLTHAVLAEPLDEVVAEGLVAEDAEHTGRLRFAHDLVRVAVYEDIPRLRRTQWHRAFADALGAIHDPTRLGELARHRVRSVDDDESAVAAADACVAAARSAAAQFGPVEAVGWYDDALQLIGYNPARRARLLIATARVEADGGQVADAVRRCQEALDLAEGHGLLPEAAEAAAVVRDVAGPLAPAIRTLCERARGLLGEEASARHARVLAREAFVLADTPEHPRARQLSERASEMAEASGDPSARIEALHAHVETHDHPSDLPRLSELGTRMRALGEEADRLDAQLWSYIWRIESCFAFGDLATLDAELHALGRLVDRTRWPLARWHLLSSQAARASLLGEMPLAFELTGGALEIATRTQDASAVAVSRGQHLGLMINTERVDHGKALHTFDGPVAPIGLALIGYAASSSGNLDAAQSFLGRLRPVLDTVPHDSKWMVMTCLTGVTAARLADRTLADACYRTCLPYLGMYLNASTGDLGSVDVLLGQNRLACGELDAAATHLAAGLEMEQRIEALPSLVKAQLACAELNVRRGPDGHRTALAFAREAGLVATRLGLKPLAAAAADLVDRLGTARTAPLTAREREIAQLIADGRSNRQIADRLVLSERTVESHVRNTLTKLDLSNRTELATWLLRH